MSRSLSAPLLVAVAVALLVPGGDSRAASRAEMEKYNEHSRRMDEIMQQHNDNVSAVADRHNQNVARTAADIAAIVDAAERKLAEAVLATWGEYYGSNTIVWSDYGPKKDSNSRVDFDRGEVVVEALVEKGAPKAEAERKIEEQFKRAIEKKAEEKPVLDKQVETREKTPVTPKNADQFYRTEVAPKVEKKATVTGSDGKQRDRYRVTVPMVPDHLARRVETVLPVVKEQAGRLGLRRSLVLGVIHMESSFNPLARSVPIVRKDFTTHAYGLMQVVPEFAGAEVYQDKNGRPGKPAPQDLYVPVTNMDYGTSFLGRLRDRSACSRLNTDTKKMYCSIAAYNAGAGFVGKRLNIGEMNSISDEEFRARLVAAAPKEKGVGFASYLEEVVKRMEKLRAYD